MKRKALLLCLNILLPIVGMAQSAVEVWPDGTAIDAWFKNTQKVDVGSLGKKYVITDYGVEKDSSKIQTKEIQAVIFVGSPVLQAPHPSSSSGRCRVEGFRAYHRLPRAHHTFRG